MTRRMYRALLRTFAVIEKPAAWVLLIGGTVTLIAVVAGLIAVGSAKWATVLIAADLIVGGFGAVQGTTDSDERESIRDEQD